MSPDMLTIAGMALVTALPRILPLLLLTGRNLPSTVTRWLGFIPPAVLAALLAPDLLLGHAQGEAVLSISVDNHFLMAAFPATAVCLWTRSFFGTVAVGMASVALIRFLA